MGLVPYERAESACGNAKVPITQLSIDLVGWVGVELDGGVC